MALILVLVSMTQDLYVTHCIVIRFESTGNSVYLSEYRRITHRNGTRQVRLYEETSTQLYLMNIQFDPKASILFHSIFSY